MRRFYDGDNGDLIVVAVLDTASKFSHAKCVPTGWTPKEDWGYYLHPTGDYHRCAHCDKLFNAVTGKPISEFHPF